MAPVIYTIGHSSHPQAVFTALLRQHGVSLLADVRSVPASRHVPAYSRPSLQQWLAAAGIAYRWLGDRLGGRPDDPALWRQGRPDYARMAALPQFGAGIDEVLAYAAGQTVALMCAEKDPADCHRGRLVAPVLAAQADIQHILADGSLLPHARLAPTARQPDLFA